MVGGGGLTSARDRTIALAHLGHVVHEVHAWLVGFGVGQLEERGHPEADGVGSVAALSDNGEFTAEGPKQTASDGIKKQLCRRTPTEFM